MADWVVVVDDDVQNLERAEHILSNHDMQVTAVQSGDALLELVHESIPDLILLDSDVSGTDGFEILRRLRPMFPIGTDIPIIFLSADETQEAELRSLKMGALDFIRKPFDPEVLLARVQHILETQRRMHQFERDATTDDLTGFLTRNASEAKLLDLCRSENGMLLVVDLDVFKLVNDLYGHDVGDQVLVIFAQLLRTNMRSDDVCGRIGGDEFVIFARNMKTEADLQHFVSRINNDYVARVKELIGTQMQLPIGVSVGAVAVPEQGRDYPTLFHLADQELFTVKQNGKHGCRLCGNHSDSATDELRELNLDTITSILEERNITPDAMWMGRDAFTSIYRYMVRYMERYNGMAYRVLFTITVNEGTAEEDRKLIVNEFRRQIQHSLRNSDVMMEIGENKLFLMLPETKDYDIDRVVSRLLERWRHSPWCSRASITYETGQVHLEKHDAPDALRRDPDSQ